MAVELSVSTREESDQHKNLVIGDEPIESKLISVIACFTGTDVFPKSWSRDEDFLRLALEHWTVLGYRSYQVVLATETERESSLMSPF